MYIFSNYLLCFFYFALLRLLCFKDIHIFSNYYLCFFCFALLRLLCFKDIYIFSNYQLCFFCFASVRLLFCSKISIYFPSFTILIFSNTNSNMFFIIKVSRTKKYANHCHIMPSCIISILNK